MPLPAFGDFKPPPELIEHLIREHGLRSETGVVVCWQCRYRPATLPVLHCEACLKAHRDKPRSGT